MSSFPNKRGNILASLLALLGITGLAFYFGSQMINRQKAARFAIESKNYPVTTSSAVEVALLAFRAAERNYYRNVRSFYGTPERPGPCKGPARSFSRALMEGVGCVGADGKIVKTGLEMNLLTAADWAASPPPFISYVGGGCRFESDGKASCASSSKEFLKVGGGGTWNEYFGGVHSFAIEKVDMAAGLLVLKVSVDGVSKDSSYRVGLRWNAGNLAHLEVQGRVTQERPDPSGLCTTDQRPDRKGKVLGPWSPLYVFDSVSSSCRDFVQIGSGRGLAFFDDHYLGLRPSNGQMMVYNNLFHSHSAYLLDESGNLLDRYNKTSAQDPPLGLAYSKEALTNVDDITIVEGHIYYVANQGEQGHIGYLGKGDCPKSAKGAVQFPGWCRIPVCRLGEQGFAMRSRGLAAPSWTQSLFRTTDGEAEGSGGSRRSTTFLVKTSAGGLLRAVAWNNPGETPYTDCAVVMDSEEQVVEYKRTQGFDRASTERPYFVY
jgi:hypothetical protein